MVLEVNGRTASRWMRGILIASRRILSLLVIDEGSRGAEVGPRFREYEAPRNGLEGVERVMPLKR